MGFWFEIDGNGHGILICVGYLRSVRVLLAQGGEWDLGWVTEVKWES